jgi:hypothetical protein
LSHLHHISLEISPYLFLGSFLADSRYLLQFINKCHHSLVGLVLPSRAAEALGALENKIEPISSLGRAGKKSPGKLVYFYIEYMWHPLKKYEIIYLHTADNTAYV